MELNVLGILFVLLQEFSVKLQSCRLTKYVWIEKLNEKESIRFFHFKQFCSCFYSHHVALLRQKI